MSKTLIIAEKPSLARNICAAIQPTPTFTKSGTKSGYYENADYIVAYAYGHLLTLQDAASYNEEYKQWKEEDLPIIPSPFKYEPTKEGESVSQLKLLIKLINDKNVNKIVNAGDSDREGEIIVRNILKAAKNTKPVYRLWMPDQTPSTIKKELAAMKPDSDYDNLANEGFARTYIDWIYGINLTRLVSLKSDSYKHFRSALRIGRVTSPIVTVICERERAIRNFKPETYYVAEHKDGSLDLISEIKCEKMSDCEDLCKEYDTLKTEVKDKTTTQKTMSRPHLFALSDLQGVAGKTLGWDPKKTLDVLQTLYEDGYASYPRTNSCYMAENEKQKAKDILSALSVSDYSSMFDKSVEFRDSKQIFNDKEIEAHSAITPTTSIPSPSKISFDQAKLYELILKRFASVFCKEDYIVSTTSLKIDNGEEEFTISSSEVISKGYTKFEPSTVNNNPLPPLNKGDIITTHFTPLEKQTQPPNHFTADSLNKYLKNPYSKSEVSDASDEDKDVISEVEIGTEATRAGIIDSAIKSKYITFSKNRYGITDIGEFYVDALNVLGIDMTRERTLSLGKALKQVYKNEKSVKDAVTQAEDDVKDICNGTQTKKIEDEIKAPATNKIGVCRCGGDITEMKFSYTCNQCKHSISKDDKFFASLGKKMTAKMAVSLLAYGKTKVSDIVSKKTGKKYDTVVVAEFEADAKYPKYSLDFGSNNNKKK